MKPSQRIKEINENLNEVDPIKELITFRGPSIVTVKAIIQYLDEEYVKEHPHEIGLKCNCVECDIARAEMPDAGSK